MSCDNFDIDVYRADDFNKDSPSDTFISSLENKGGQSAVTCNCGKRHIAYMGCGNEEEYFEYIESEAPLDKTVEIHYNDSFVHFTLLAGRTFVIGCGCNGLKNYENFIWEERNTIQKYLKNRILLEKQRAEEEHLINIMSGICYEYK